MIRRRWLVAAVTLAGIALTGLGIRPGAAQTPASALPSPEESLFAILPYALQPSDAPRGFQVLTEGAGSPSELAYEIGDTPDDSQQVLAMVQRDLGLRVELVQALVPDQSTPVRIFEYIVTLFASDAKASAGLHSALDLSGSSTLTVDNPPLAARLGDEAGALHVVIANPDGSGEQREKVVWRRGPVTFEFILATVDSTETLDQVAPIAQAVDARFASLPRATPPPQATRASFGSEELRVDALYGLVDRLPDQTQAPIGMRLGSTAVINNADLVLGVTDPEAMYARLLQWKRITGVSETYSTLQAEDGAVLSVEYALSADATGARAAMLDPLRRAGSSGFAAYALPTPLGDDGRLYYETYTTDNGLPHDAWRAIWVRGQVVLSVLGTAPSGAIGAQDVAAFAAVVDARYNKGAVPSVLTAPLPGAIPPGAIPPIGTPTPVPITGR